MLHHIWLAGDPRTVTPYKKIFDELNEDFPLFFYDHSNLQEVKKPEREIGYFSIILQPLHYAAGSPRTLYPEDFANLRGALDYKTYEKKGFGGEMIFTSSMALSRESHRELKEIFQDKPFTLIIGTWPFEKKKNIVRKVLEKKS